MIIWKGADCMWSNCYIFQGIDTILLGIFSCFLGLVFAIFVCVMFYDQIDCILTN